MIIDPVLDFAWTTLVGGAGIDWASNWHGTHVDAAGAVTIAGRTASVDFPATVGAPGLVYNGGSYDAYAARLN